MDGCILQDVIIILLKMILSLTFSCIKIQWSCIYVTLWRMLEWFGIHMFSFIEILATNTGHKKLILRRNLSVLGSFITSKIVVRYLLNTCTKRLPFFSRIGPICVGHRTLTMLSIHKRFIAKLFQLLPMYENNELNLHKNWLSELNRPGIDSWAFIGVIRFWSYGTRDSGP